MASRRFRFSGQCALGGRLRAQIEAGVHGQARGGEIRLGVVALQVPPHQIEIGRNIAAAGRPQAERGRGGAFRRGGIDQVRIGEFLQHEIAPRARAVGVLARIIIGGALDQSDQHRKLAHVELVEGLGEVILAAESEAVDGARAVLAEIHLVEVGDEDFFLGEMRLEPQCHHRLGHLAAEALLVGQKVVLDQLLRQRAAALHHAAGPQVGPQGAQDAQHIDAVMLIEAPVLDQFDARAQQRRHVGGREDQPVFAVDGKYAADHGRIEAEHRQLRAIALPQGRDRVRVRADRDLLGFPLLVDEAHAARMQIEGAAVPPIQSGARGGIAGAVMQAAQFLLEIVRRDLRTHVEFERRRVDARRHGPVPALEFPGDDAVEVRDPDGSRDREHGAHHEQRRPPAQEFGTCRAGFSQNRRSPPGVRLDATIPAGPIRGVPR